MLVKFWVQGEALDMYKFDGKDLEVRVGDFFVRRVVVGDVLVINERLRRRVQAIRQYETFVEMLEHEDFRRIAPGVSGQSEVLRRLRLIYPERRERLGVYVLELKPVDV